MIILRKAEIKDIKTLFNWANDPINRKYSFNTEIISWEEHKKWFQKKVNNSEKSIIFIAESLNNNKIGQIRFDRKDDIAFIDYYIDAEFRGRGLGVELLKLGCAELIKYWPMLNKIIGEVLVNNIPSIKSFQKANFDSEILNDRIIFIKILNKKNN